MAYANALFDSIILYVGLCAATRFFSFSTHRQIHQICLMAFSQNHRQATFRSHFSLHNSTQEINLRMHLVFCGCESSKLFSN